MSTYKFKKVILLVTFYEVTERNIYNLDDSFLESSEIVKRFHVKLKDCREKLKDRDKMWTQQYVADQIGVARVTYTAYENGTKEPPLDTVKQLAGLFNVTTDYLLGKSSHPELTEVEEKEVDKEVDELIAIIESMPEDEREKMKEKILAYAKGLADASQ